MTDESGPRDVIARIERAFGRDVDAWLACFDEPLVFVGPDDTVTIETRDAARPWFESNFEALRAAGFESTGADEIRVRPMGEGMALVDAHFTRRRSDGSVLERLAALYVCRRPDDGTEWRVAALVRHGEDVHAIER